MFAVKGWKVDSNQLKPQTELFKTAPDATGNSETTDKKASRKRKRDNADSTTPTQVAEPHTTTETQDKKQRKKVEKEEAKRAKEESRQAAQKPATAAKQNDQRGAKDDGPSKLKKKAASVEKTKTDALPVSTVETAKLTPMQAAMKAKLISARFRHLNETLYTAPSQDAQELFNSNPEMFEDYHAGFRQQVSVWPENPVDRMIEKIRRRGAVRLPNQKKAFKDGTQPMLLPDNPPLPRTQGTCVIADCGCGDARLAQTLKSANDTQKLNVKVLSYDLHSPSSLITKADISKLPLADGSVDVVIFCLALMGTNWISFIEEAFRVLHWKGELWIAEIKSRFARAGGKKGRVVEHSVGNRQKRALLQKAQETKRKEAEEAAEDDMLSTQVDGVVKTQETDVQSFVDVLQRRGFVLKDDNAVDLSNKMFVSMEFVKAAAPTKGKGHVESAPSGKKKFIPKAAADEVPTDDEGKTLKPCLYKIR